MPLPPTHILYKGVRYKLVKALMRGRKWNLTTKMKVPATLTSRWEVNEEDILSSVDNQIEFGGSDPQYSHPALLAWHPTSGELLLASLGGFAGTHAHLVHESGSKPYDDYIRAVVFPGEPGDRYVEIYPWFPDLMSLDLSPGDKALCRRGQQAFANMLKQHGVSDSEINPQACALPSRKRASSDDVDIDEMMKPADSPFHFIDFKSEDDMKMYAGEPHIGVISIKDFWRRDPVKLQGGWGGVLRLSFDDIEQAGGYRGSNEVPFDHDDAKKIIDWVEQNKERLNGLYVHCWGGISRSAAVAKFLAEKYNVPFDHSYDKYNKLVYRMLKEADSATRTATVINYKGFTYRLVKSDPA